MKVFTEEQRFRKWFLLPILALPFIGILLIYTLENKELPTQESEAFWGITITLSILVIVSLFILSINLKTKIDEKGVFYQFYPIHFGEKFIAWNEIDKCYLKEYNSIHNFRGYGYRIQPFGKMKGKTINVGGNSGIQLELKNGGNLLIGTQKVTDAKRVLETYKQKIES
jgi:hypothetical protein